MSQLSPERRKVAVLGGSIAAMSGCVALFANKHPVLMGIWLGMLFYALIYTIIQLVKIKKKNAERRRDSSV
jgi:hypothetical protein